MEPVFITQYSDLIGLLVNVILKRSTDISELCWICECLNKEYRLMVLGKHLWQSEVQGAAGDCC